MTDGLLMNQLRGLIMETVGNLIDIVTMMVSKAVLPSESVIVAVTV